MKKSIVAFTFLFMLMGCGNKPKETYSQKIERYEQEVGMQSVAYFAEQAEMYAKQPVQPVFIDTATNYATPSIFNQSRNGLSHQSKDN